MRVLAKKMANVARTRTFFIGSALTGLRPRIVSMMKRSTWSLSSTVAVWISLANARRRVLMLD
jgi:hypothetical protein